MAESNFWHLDALAAENPRMPGETLRQTWFHHGSHSSTNLLDVEPEAALQPHYHREHDEIVYVVKGAGEFSIGRRHLNVAPGDVMITPAGTVHSARAGIRGLLVLSVFVPSFD